MNWVNEVSRGAKYKVNNKLLIRGTEWQPRRDYGVYVDDRSQISRFPVKVIIDAGICDRECVNCAWEHAVSIVNFRNVLPDYCPTAISLATKANDSRAHISAQRNI